MNTKPTSPLAAVAPATTCSRLAKCSACGRITNDYVMYGSLFLTDEYPSQCPHVCGSECMATVADKIESGEWEVPVLRKAHGGYCHDISKPRKGYDAQPDQAILVNALIHAANVKCGGTAAQDSQSEANEGAYPPLLPTTCSAILVSVG